MGSDVTSYPIAVAQFSANGIMTEAHYLADLIQQLELGIGDNEFLGHRS